MGWKKQENNFFKILHNNKHTNNKILIKKISIHNRVPMIMVIILPIYKNKINYN